MISWTKRTPWRHKNNWYFTYFFSMTCFSLLMSPKRRSKLSQRSRVSLNLAFMLLIWKIYVHRTIGIRRRQRENTINVCAECGVAPPRPSPSPGGRSCSPSKSSGTPADSSAGTSTAEEQNPSEHFCVYQADKTASRRRLPLVEVRRSSRRGRCRPHTRTAPSSRPSYWPPADERSYLPTQTSTRQTSCSVRETWKIPTSSLIIRYWPAWMWLMWEQVSNLYRFIRAVFMCCDQSNTACSQRSSPFKKETNNSNQKNIIRRLSTESYD